MGDRKPHQKCGTSDRGPVDTPILQELRAVTVRLALPGEIVVLIDDVRCFRSGSAGLEGYPSLDDLVDWARANGMGWHIEHDVFVARRPA